jgi:hypothetical protein
VRVLHVPTAVGGNAPSVARAERALGLDSKAIELAPNTYGYACDETVWGPGDSVFGREVKRWRLFRRALREFDVIHFNFGRTILTWSGVSESTSARLHPFERLAMPIARRFDLVDLPLLRGAGKVIAVTFQGDDARQADYCRAHFKISPITGAGAGYYSSTTDARKRRRIDKFDRYADLIYALNPDLLHVLPERARFLPYANIDPQTWRRAASHALPERPVVLHAPSHRGVKGTEHIVRAAERLQAEGVPFEFRLVEGLTHAEARRLYERADLAVDQVLAGWYGGFAVEMMAFGVPVVAYLREGDLAFLPEAMRRDLPVVSATPGTVYAVLKSLLTARRGELADLGRRSRAYVETWHDPLRVAATLKADYETAAQGKRS